MGRGQERGTRGPLKSGYGTGEGYERPIEKVVKGWKGGTRGALKSGYRTEEGYERPIEEWVRD